MSTPFVTPRGCVRNDTLPAPLAIGCVVVSLPWLASGLGQFVLWNLYFIYIPGLLIVTLVLSLTGYAGGDTAMLATQIVSVLFWTGIA